jgi:nucleotide-binding universal stress UspA family protein
VSAKESAQTTSRKHDTPRTAEITTRVETGDSAQAVAEEAEKGFDMLFIGLEKMVTAQGGFTDEINRIAAEFEGPIALVLAGADRDADWFGRPNIVIPVDGTPASRSGAEIAFSLAPNTRRTVLTAVHTSERATSPGKPRIRRNGTPRGAEKATLDDVKALGERYGFRVGTASHLRVAPEKAILTEAGRVKADLLVIGANRRVGEGLFLGEVAVALMKQWPGGLVLVAV